MNIYRKVLTRSAMTSEDETNREHTLGGKVKLKAVKQGWNPKTQMNLICDEFYKQLVGYSWRWTPSRAAGSADSAAKVLDGEMVHAECQVVAKAFQQLLLAPEPYGFGYTSATAKLRTYSGERSMIGVEEHGPTDENSRRVHEMGFYSKHPAAGVHHLNANVYDPSTGRMADLYAWKDHKVVEAENRFWDVCYNTSYSVLQEMAVALVVGTNEDKRPTKTIQEAMARISEYKVMIKNWMQIAYFRSAGIGTAAANAGAKEVGPYADSIFGDESSFGHLTPLIKWGREIRAADVG